MDDPKNKEELKSSKQRKVLDRMVAELGGLDSRIYYLSTVEIAQLIEAKLEADSGLNQAEQELMSGLSSRDIQILLSIHPT
ncbi:MAG: hypothetical protein AAGF72_19635 [Pseudomonadota bacterium]